MESPKQIRYEYPIIADYTNLCYFRSWRGNKMHAHQPRKRSVYEIAKNFINDLTAVNGGEYLNEPMNQSLAYNQIKNYDDSHVGTTNVRGIYPIRLTTKLFLQVQHIISVFTWSLFVVWMY